MGRQIGGCGGLTDSRRLRRQRPRLLPLLPLLLLTAVAGHQLAAANIFGGDTNTASQCSRACESEHCTAAPLMRYGKYCGVSYTGCPGDALDACVQATDNDYLNMWCNQSLLDCVATARPSTATFEGNRCNVTEVAGRGGRRVQFAMRILHKP